MKKLLIILGILVSGSLFANSEINLGLIQTVIIKPSLDTSVQGYSFNYSYFITDNLGLGVEMDSIVTTVDSRKYNQLPLLFSFTARFGSDTCMIPLTIEGGPDFSISTGASSIGGTVIFQTGIQAFVNDNVGFKILVGPGYTRISSTNFFITKVGFVMTFRFV